MQGDCSAGKGCSFLHPPSGKKAAPAPKTKSGANKEDKNNKKDKEKPEGKVSFHAPQSVSFVSMCPKTVRLSKFSQNQSVRHCKNPTYLKWGLNNKNYVKQWTNQDGQVIFPDEEAVEQYAEHARREALKLYNQLSPTKRLSPEDFVQEGSKNAAGDRDQAKNFSKVDLEGATAKPKEKPKVFYI